ncbi:MAG: hypothetical protein U0528_20650 [Anaerolineae bacterium]
MADDLETLLNQGIQAARSGDKATARRLIEQVLEQNDRIERAWLALASVVDTARERRLCLENVLEINPNNDRARQLLEQLGPAEAGSAAASSVRSVATTSANKSAAPARPAAPAQPAAQSPSARNFTPPVIPPKTPAGRSASSGTRDAWRGQRNQRGFRLSIPFITIAIISVLAIVGGLTLLLPGGGAATATPSTRTATLSEAQIIGTQFPFGTPTVTVPGFIVTDISTLAVNIAPTWTFTAPPKASSTPRPKPTLPAITDYVLAYIGERDGRPSGSIYVASGDGSDEKQIVVSGNDPVWSPDGSQLAYIGVTNGSPALLVVNADGSDPQLLVQMGSSSLSGPAWSPNGDRVAFASNLEGNYEIYVVPATGGDPQRLTVNAGDDLSPTWSPDGATLVYASDVTGRKALQIVALTLATGQIRQLTESQGQNTDPSYSPDGKSILFTSTRGRFGDIYIMRADGSDERLLTVDDGNAENRQPAWSSDGNYVVFTSNRNGGVLNLFIMTPDGKNVRQITNQAGASYRGRFRPNGF